MRDYEIVYIFKSSFTPEEIEGKLDRYHTLLTGADGAEITAVEQWGKRPLAYPISKEPNGYYVVAQFNADAEALPELERQLKLDEDLLRYLIVLSEGEPAIPASVREREEERGGARPHVAAKTAESPSEAKAQVEGEATADEGDAGVAEVTDSAETLESDAAEDAPEPEAADAAPESEAADAAPESEAADDAASSEAADEAEAVAEVEAAEEDPEVSAAATEEERSE